MPLFLKGKGRLRGSPLFPASPIDFPRPSFIVSFDTINHLRPPYRITPRILSLHSGISRHCGLLEGWGLTVPQPELRRSNRIRAIQASLAIEGNTLSIDQVTAVLDGNRVLGPARDILEAQNAVRAYSMLESYDILSPKSFLKAHGILLDGLVPDAGKWRAGNVGIQKGKAISHVAPPAARVPGIMADLFAFLKSAGSSDLPIASCVFHYEAAFVHPFTDGNGRMARLWQSAILRKHHPAFAYVPIESAVKGRQKGYYRALEAADRKGESTPFIEFMLEVVSEALQEFISEIRVPVRTAATRLEAAQAAFATGWFTRKDYLARFKDLSTATASRDLKAGVDSGRLQKAGDGPMTRYRMRAAAAGKRIKGVA